MQQSARPSFQPALWGAIGLSLIVAIIYGAIGSNLYTGTPPHVVGAVFKCSSIVILGLIALFAGSRLLGVGLLLGALGDALLAWSPDTFLLGAIAFLIGHLFYIALFLRAGRGPRVFANPAHAALALAAIFLALTMNALLVPRDHAPFIPICVYTGVLAFMTVTSFTLPAANRLATFGAVLFLVSDMFVAWNTFHPDPDPTRAFWRLFIGWMLYWTGQAGICAGALGLHKRR